MAELRTGDESNAHHDEAARPRAAGAAVGGLGGAVAGAAVGTVTAGPIGTIVGAIAGALGGGWAGLASGGVERHYDASHDAAYRAHYEGGAERLADRGFEHARPAYQLGHLAARNPDYAGRPFDAVEPDLRRGWTDHLRTSHGDWEAARRYARYAYENAGAYGVGSPLLGVIAQERMTDIGGTESHQRPSFSDPIPPGDPDHVAGEDGRVPGRDEG